jgi:tetratricopeptide (TPR) repeat protein
VPAWLCRLVERGLAEQPEQRHASMDALLVALRRARARGRKRMVIAGAVALCSVFAITGAIAAQRIAGDDSAEPCMGAEQELASVWTNERAERVRKAFTATGLPYATDTWQSVDRSIKAYRERWVSGWREACVATAVRKEQSAELLDKRMVCLERKRAELSSLVDVLGAADRTLVADGPLAVAKLSPPEACADREAMLAAPAPPADVGQRVTATMVTQSIANARALWAAGQFVRGLELLGRMQAHAERVAHLPTLASFLSIKGLLEDETSAFDQAEATWRRTIQVAAQAGDTWIVARTWLDLIRLLGVRKRDSKQALTLVPAAQAAVALSRNPDLENRLHSYLGSIHREAENFVEAEKELKQGLAGYQRRARSAYDWDVATASTNLGLTMHALGKLEESEKLHRSALAIFEHLYGPQHPRTAAVHNNLGMVLQGMEKFEDARKEFQTCIDVLSAALGPDHVSLAGLYSNLALAQGGTGKRQEADATHRRAVAILEAKLPPNHPTLATVRANLALELEGVGQLDEARRLLEVAVKSNEATYGPNDRRTAQPLGQLADLLAKQKQCGKARPIYKRVIAIHESFNPVDEYMLALALDGAAKCATADAERIAILERALALRLAIDEQPQQVAATQLSLARALRKTDPTRARKIATDARVRYVALGENGKAEVTAIDAEFGGS